MVFPKEYVNTLYTKNKIDIRQEVWAIFVDLKAWWPSPSPSSPPPQAKTTLKKTQGKRAGATGNRQQRHQPTAKAETFKQQCLCTPRLHKAGPQTQQQTAHTCSKPGCGQICSASQLHTVLAHCDSVLIGNKMRSGSFLCLTPPADTDPLPA